MAVRLYTVTIALLALLLLSGCGAAVLPIVPTTIPTATPTPTNAPTQTPNRAITPTLSPTPVPLTPTGGPSPTPLFGQPVTALAAAATGTRVLNPNAPRIEFFTTDVLAVAPGDSVTLYWSTRNTTSANIYRLERGVRNQLYPVQPDGSLTLTTRSSDRGSVEFLLTVGDNDEVVQQTLNIPIACPDVWFFQPAPNDCPAGPAQETRLIEQPFERGRMLYVELSSRVYGLFNDGFEPAWVVLENRFNPAADPESEPSFQPPPGFFQPVRQLGFIWRGSDVVRNRLGLGVEPEQVYQGFVQSANTADGATTLYASSANGTVLQLLPDGDVWQIISTEQ